MGGLANIQALSNSEEVAVTKESSTEFTALLASTRKVQRVEILDVNGVAHPVKIPVVALKKASGGTY